MHRLHFITWKILALQRERGGRRRRGGKEREGRKEGEREGRKKRIRLHGEHCSYQSSNTRRGTYYSLYSNY